MFLCLLASSWVKIESFGKLMASHGLSQSQAKPSPSTWLWLWLQKFQAKATAYRPKPRLISQAKPKHHYLQLAPRAHSPLLSNLSCRRLAVSPLLLPFRLPLPHISSTHFNPGNKTCQLHPHRPHPPAASTAGTSTCCHPAARSWPPGLLPLPRQPLEPLIILAPLPRIYVPRLRLHPHRL
jgi:hypothetical protein